MPFFKRDSDTIHTAPLFVSGPGFELTVDNKDEHEYPVEGWYWFENLDTAMASLTEQPELSLQQQYTAALESHYDITAQTKRYDNRLTCTLRAGYPGPYQTEALSFALWMDTCNQLAYKALDEVNAGTRSTPSIKELLQELPAIIWA